MALASPGKIYACRRLNGDVVSAHVVRPWRKYRKPSRFVHRRRAMRARRACCAMAACIACEARPAGESGHDRHRPRGASRRAPRNLSIFLAGKLSPKRNAYAVNAPVEMKKMHIMAIYLAAKSKMPSSCRKPDIGGIASPDSLIISRESFLPEIKPSLCFGIFNRGASTCPGNRKEY